MRIVSGATRQMGATTSGENSCARVRTVSSPLRCSARRPGRTSPFGEEGVDHAEQQPRVGSGLDEVMLAGLQRRARAPWVDHDDLAAALLDAPQPPAHVRRRQQAAVGDERVGAEDEQIVRVIHIGDGDAEQVAEHQAAGDLLGHLVDGAGGVDVDRAERAQQDGVVELAGEVMDGGIAEVDGDAVASMLGQDGRQPPLDLGERLVPGDLAPRLAGADHRRAQAVGIAVQLLERVGFGADVAVREDVVLIAANGDDLWPAGHDLQAAGGLAERAGDVAGSAPGSALVVRHGWSLPRLPRRASWIWGEYTSRAQRASNLVWDRR